MSKGYMYILKCSDGSYYTGSTKDIELRLAQHQAGEGANYTKKKLPIALVYLEEFERIDDAFYREKQVQGWRREKKEALIKAHFDILPTLAKISYSKKMRECHFDKFNDRSCSLSLSKGVQGEFLSKGK
jgi:putative endonuclease